MNGKTVPPCQAGCPVRTDAGRYARLVAEGRYEEAYEVIARANPFPSVCAYICQRPCEKNCRRAALDAAVGLRALKRFVVEKIGENRPRTSPPPATGARLAIVGAGPAGLTAARDLRMAGHRVAVFERLDRPGGMLNVIPRYRLPQKALDSDVEAILGLGIETHFACEMGREATIAELLERGYDAVVVATGLSRSRGIAVPGFGAQRFTAAIPWMADLWLGNKVELGQRVVVIGGGNVAVDVARSARRLGAEKVAMVCLESREEMPAEPHEVALAEAEGIEVITRQALKRVLNRGGAIVAIELMKVLSVFDEAGRFRPTYDPSRIRTVAADMVILSIGQAPDKSWIRGSSIRTDARGRVAADRDTQLTSHPRVFVCGESLRGPGSAIEAVADGRRVAEIVARSLETGQVAAPAPEAVVPLDPFPQDVLDRLRELNPQPSEPEPFAPSEPLFDEAQARREAARCLGCLAGATVDENKCAACLTCLRICPLNAIKVGETVAPDPVRCQSCGLCASQCPAGAIALPVWEGMIAPAVAGESEEVTITCLHNDQAQEARGATLSVPCLARLRPVDILGFFRQGCRTVRLVPCAEDQCKYGRAWKNIESVTAYARSILAQASPQATLEVVLPQAAQPQEAATGES